MDTKGLITADRPDVVDGSIAAHKKNYIRNDCSYKDNLTIMEVAKNFKPTCLLGLSTIFGSFTKELIETVTASAGQSPIVLALSNPTTKCECTNQDAYNWSEGKVLYASGSPMPQLNLKDGTQMDTAQCNNFYVFPGIGLGAYISKCTEITDMMIVKVASALANMVKDE